MTQKGVKTYGQHIDRDPTEVVEAFGIVGEDYARKKARFAYLDEMKKTILSQIKNELNADYFASEGKELSETKMERLARADKRYEEFLEKLEKAQSDALFAEIKYRQEDKRLELLRSLETTSRAQMDKLGLNT